MRVVSRKELRKKLRKYLRLAGEGETILVTRRGRVVAELAPLRTEITSLPPEIVQIVHAAAPAKSRMTGPALLPERVQVRGRTVPGISPDLL